MNNELQIQIVQNLVPVLTADIIIGGGQQITFGDTLTGAGTPIDPVNVSSDILQQISDNTEQGENNASQISNLQNNLANIQNEVQSATEQISEIQSVIPATANTENQLVDQGFVNSSIQTATAYFRGDWATWADVPSNPELYPVDATGNHTPTTNDYMVVIADEQTNGGTWRYKYTGLWSEQGKSGWQAEYQVNETPFTAAQNAALNSGITAQAVSDIAANKSAVAALQTSKQNKLTAGSGITIENDIISGTALPDQTDNSGKALMTNGAETYWGDVLVNNSPKAYALSIGYNAHVDGYGVAIGNFCSIIGAYTLGVAIGIGQRVGASGAIQIGVGSYYTATVYNDDPDTFKVSTTKGNFEMMDADGNVPLDRLTYVTSQIGDISTALTAILGE